MTRPASRGGLDPLELACSIVVGRIQDDPLFLEVVEGQPRQALESSILTALNRPPCIVTFSGGRDSSALLATATHVARREGLPDPVPFTFRYPGRPETDESEWQELVIRHLRLRDWLRHDIDGELELVGPVATSVLHRHGVLWPPNAHAHVLPLEAAGEGGILTGLDGDGLFGGWSFRHVADVVGGRQQPSPRDVLRLGRALAPAPVRRAWQRRRSQLNLTWLRPDAAAAVESAWASERAAEPSVWSRRVRWWSRLRYHHLARSAYDQLARDTGAQIVHPFLEPTFLGALARDGGITGYGDRTAIMRHLFGDLLPDAVLSRSDKARFTLAFWGPATRRFTEQWDGSGVDTDLVDPDALREVWRRPVPDFRTAMLVQSAYLASLGD